ncbi:MAG TPA: group III truncated hemoglobin [Kaistia sp.]|nr:group III truncated hemoglobin [Kaistia sp.]
MNQPIDPRGRVPLTLGTPDGVDEDGIRRLVHGFYDAVQADALLGPVFAREVEDGRWPEHLAKMCDFWSSVLLKTRRYEGRPLAPHLRLADLSDAHFERWLSLFAETARRSFEPDAAAVVIAFAERIANSFRLSRALHRGEDTTRLRPIAAA